MVASTETFQARENEMTYSKKKKKTFQSYILYLAKLSFRNGEIKKKKNEGEIDFLKQKLRELITTGYKRC